MIRRVFGLTEAPAPVRTEFTALHLQRNELGAEAGDRPQEHVGHAFRLAYRSYGRRQLQGGPFQTGGGVSMTTRTMS